MSIIKFHEGQFEKICLACKEDTICYKCKIIEGYLCSKCADDPNIKIIIVNIKLKDAIEKAKNLAKRRNEAIEYNEKHAEIKLVAPILEHFKLEQELERNEFIAKSHSKVLHFIHMHSDPPKNPKCYIKGCHLVADITCMSCGRYVCKLDLGLYSCDTCRECCYDLERKL